eukprot:299986-Heterocapsa_arctica.AAC.1
MPQSAGSVVLYVYVKHFCAAFCALAICGPMLYISASRCNKQARRADVPTAQRDPTPVVPLGGSGCGGDVCPHPGHPL